jgi:hypothetical protein
VSKDFYGVGKIFKHVHFIFIKARVSNSIKFFWPDFQVNPFAQTAEVFKLEEFLLRLKV